MAKLFQTPDGKVYREVAGGYEELSGEERGGALAASKELGGITGAGKAAVLGFGREALRVGRGVQNLYAKATGDEATQQRLAAADQAEAGIMAGTGEQGGLGTKAAMFAGQVAPYLATAPLGAGLTGARALAMQSGLGALTGGIGYSGDQGTDAITGALLGAAGLGGGVLAGKVTNMVRAKGAATRAAIKAEQQAALEAAQAAQGPGGVGGTLQPGALDGQGLPALQLGQAAVPGANAGVPLGSVPGIASENMERAAIIARAEKSGLKFTDAQKSGNVVEQQLEEGFRANPWTSGKYQRMAEDNQKILNRKAAESFGEKADVLSQDVLSRANSRIGGVMEDASKAIGTLDNTNPAILRANTKLDEIINEASQGTVIKEAMERAAEVKSVWDGGKVTGKILQRERRKLTNEIQKAARAGDGNMVEALHQITQVVDDVIADSLPRQGAGGVVLAQLKDARHEFRNLATLTKANAISAAGDVTPGRAYEGFRRNFNQEMVLGRSATDYGASVPGGAGMQLMDMLRAAQALPFTVGKVGGSPTATRMSVQGLLTNPKDTIIQGAMMRALEPASRMALRLGQTPGGAAAGALGAGLGRPIPGIMGAPE